MAQRKLMKGRFIFLSVAGLGLEALLLVLAYWQWGRYQQRMAQQVEFAARPSLIIMGTFLNSQTVALDNQPNPSNPEDEVGWRILTPLQSGTGVVVVDRGWARPHLGVDGAPDFTPFATTATQVLAVPQAYPRRRGWLKGPDTTTHPRLLAFLNPDLIVSATAASGAMVPEYLVATQGTGGQGITPLPPPLPSPLRHLSYMLQWLGMAVAFPILCAAAWAKNRRKSRGRF